MRFALLATAAVTAFIAFAPAANAVTETTKITVQQKDIPDVNKVNLTVFDVDQNGVLSMKEVGTYLFKIFDTDGNHSIDNIEFKQTRFMTIIPMEKETLKLVDYNSDGKAEQVEHTYEEFVQKSQLARFDDDQDGLSPNEFIGEGYEVLDDDEDKLISLEEWEEAYLGLVSGKVNEPERYQN
jgi:Ca2+-binding EF-hand superfamily protein